MRNFEENFDGLYFTESVLGPSLTDGKTITVPVSGLFVLERHPLSAEGPGPYKGELVFCDVRESRRRIVEYIGDSRNPDGYKPTREEVQVLTESFESGSSFREFGMEGYQESPSAWIEDWTILAGSFVLRVE